MCMCVCVCAHSIYRPVLVLHIWVSIFEIMNTITKKHGSVFRCLSDGRILTLQSFPTGKIRPKMALTFVKHHYVNAEQQTENDRKVSTGEQESHSLATWCHWIIHYSARKVYAGLKTLSISLSLSPHFFTSA